MNDHATPSPPPTTTVWRAARYGSAALQCRESAPTPRPGKGEVLVKVAAVSLNSGDVRLMRGDPALVRLFAGMRGPRIAGRGMDVAGTVVAVGEGVTAWSPGDEVFGVGRETLADHCVAKASQLARRPEGLPAHVASTLPIAGTTALAALAAVDAAPGSRILVVGAGGGVGTLVAQLAASRGAEVWVTCGARAEATLTALGATRTFDYRRTALDSLPARHFDGIVDIAGAPPLTVLARLLAPRGTVALVGGDGHRMWGPIPRILHSLFVRGRFRPITAVTRAADLETLRDLAASGAITPVVQQEFDLDHARDALALIDDGHVVGKVVVRGADSAPDQP